MIAFVYIAYVAIGVVAGILGGLLGIGGGIITVPCFLFLFSYLDFPQSYLMHIAIATSLAAMIFNTAAATMAQSKRSAIVWEVFRKLVPGLVIGSVLGAFIATWLSTVVLEVVFGIFLLLLAAHFYFKKTIKGEKHRLPHPLLLNIYSCSIGAASNILGIGGGSMTVPLLTHFKMKDKKAIGTSTATTLITTTCGAISYLILGWQDVNLNGTFGLINIPAFLIVGISAFFMAPYGVKLTHEIDPSKIRKIFAIVLALTGLSLII